MPTLATQINNQTVLQYHETLYFRDKDCYYILSDTSIKMVRRGQIVQFTAEREPNWYEMYKALVVKYEPAPLKEVEAFMDTVIADFINH